MPYRVIRSGDILEHHGIKGQKWGDRNGPPYPLDYEDHSPMEKKHIKKLASDITEHDKSEKYKRKESIRIAERKTQREIRGIKDDDELDKKNKNTQIHEAKVRLDEQKKLVNEYYDYKDRVYLNSLLDQYGEENVEKALYKSAADRKGVSMLGGAIGGGVGAAIRVKYAQKRLNDVLIERDKIKEKEQSQSNTRPLYPIK